MKFTRTLTLALAAVAALSMTACDEDSATSPSGDNSVSCTGRIITSGTLDIKTNWVVGTQSSATNPSFASIRYAKTWLSAALRANNYAAWDSVDLVVFADSTDNTHASFYSPARAKEVFKGSAVANNPSPKRTLFKLLAADAMPGENAEEVTAFLKKISFDPAKNDQHSVREGQLVAARLDDGTCALLDVTTSNEQGAFKIDLGIDLTR